MIKNVIFSGGGLKGWAYIGTLQALDELIPRNNLEHIIGVSIGSIFGLFYLLDIKWDILLDFIMEINFKEVVDINIDDVLINQSILAGKIFADTIKQIIATKIDPDITFKQLNSYSKIKYTINAINITKSKLEYFNYELTPDIKIIDAIRASSAIPLLFPPIYLNGSYYYDGGICNNCPFELVDEICTIAFDVSSINETHNSYHLLDLLNSLMYIFNKGVKPNIFFKILDKRFDKESLNINQTRDDIFNIYKHGYLNSKNIIYNNFIAIK